MAGAEEVGAAPPKLRENPAELVWGAVAVRTDPRVRPVPVAAEEGVDSEKGEAEAAGFPKPRLNPVEAAVEVVRLPTNT